MREIIEKKGINIASVQKLKNKSERTENKRYGERK